MDVLFIIAVVIYFLPTVVAYMRGHPQANPITVINLFLGWTLLGWVVALAWSSSAFQRGPERGR